jgi:hypothetical protein
MKLSKKSFAEKRCWMLNVGNNISISMLSPRKEHSLIELFTSATSTVISVTRAFELVDIGLWEPEGRRYSPTIHGISLSIFTANTTYRTP